MLAGDEETKNNNNNNNNTPILWRNWHPPELKDSPPSSLEVGCAGPSVPPMNAIVVLPNSGSGSVGSKYLHKVWVSARKGAGLVPKI